MRESYKQVLTRTHKEKSDQMLARILQYTHRCVAWESREQTSTLKKYSWRHWWCERNSFTNWLALPPTRALRLEELFRSTLMCDLFYERWMGSRWTVQGFEWSDLYARIREVCIWDDGIVKNLIDWRIILWC